MSLHKRKSLWCSVTDLRSRESRSSTRIALIIAAVTFTLRPTNLVLWIFLGAHLVFLRWSTGRRKEAWQVIIDAFWFG